MYHSKIVEAMDVKVRQDSNGQCRELRPITTLERCINCGTTVMHRSRFGMDCGEAACVEETPAVVKKLQQDLQTATLEHAKDKRYWEDKIGMLDDLLDVWRSLAKKRRKIIGRLKFKLEDKEELIDVLREDLK